MSHRGNPDQDNDDLWIKPPRWYDGADVIVVGFGGAGAIAAITAHDLGAKVLIIEKQPPDSSTEIHHTPSTRMRART